MNADLLPFASREPARQLPWPLACLVIAGLNIILWALLAALAWLLWLTWPLVAGGNHA